MNFFFESPEFDFTQAPQSVRDMSFLIFYTQNFVREVMSGRNSAEANKLVLRAVNRGFSFVGAILETSISVKNTGVLNI